MKLEDFGKAKKLVTKLNKLKAQLTSWTEAKKLIDTQVRAEVSNPKSGGTRTEYLDISNLNFDLLQGYMISQIEAEIKKLTEEFEAL